MYFPRISVSLPLSLLCVCGALGQSPAESPQPALALVSAPGALACDEAPREDADVSLCAPPSSEEAKLAAEVTPIRPRRIR